MKKLTESQKSFLFGKRRMSRLNESEEDRREKLVMEFMKHCRVIGFDDDFDENDDPVLIAVIQADDIVSDTNSAKTLKNLSQISSDVKKIVSIVSKYGYRIEPCDEIYWERYYNAEFTFPLFKVIE